LETMLAGPSPSTPTPPIESLGPGSATDYLPIPTSRPITALPSPIRSHQASSFTWMALTVTSAALPYWSGYNPRLPRPTGSLGNSTATGTGVTAYYPPYPTTMASGSIATTTSTIAVEPSTTAYSFNASSQDNVAVYYGQTPDTQIGRLFELCQSPNVDIVILAFVYDFFSQQGYPTIGFGPGCSPPNTAQASKAPGLLELHHSRV
jgi:hypothetical protein